MDYWEGKYISACKAPGKLGGSGEILIIDLLLDTIWWNLVVGHVQHSTITALPGS